MARYIDSVCKLCRREGEKLYLKGARCDSPKCAVERRKAARMQHAERYLFVTIAPEEVRGVELATIPRLRGWLFGDEPVQAIMLPPDSSQAEVDQLARLFPEARVDRWKVQEILQSPVDGIR